jgi:hypothetical protein
MSVAAVIATNGGEAGSGVKTDFDFSFKIFLATDLLVYIETAAGSGAYELKEYPEDYTVSFNTAAETGTVLFTVAPADGRDVLINRLTPLTQPSVLPLEGKMPAKVVEDGLDRLTLIVQDLKLLIVAPPIAPNVIEYAEGLYSAKPVASAKWLNYYSTDLESLEVWVPSAGRWFLIG